MRKTSVPLLRAFFLLLTLSGCSWFVESFFPTEDQQDQVLEMRGSVQEFAIIFSANISGETHPCGCRAFPLGGLPQVAGALAKEKALHPVLYVDSGDTFFPQLNLPSSLINSHRYTAQSLFQALDLLELKYWVPGEQDLALGSSFLQEQLPKTKFQVLAANLKNSFPLPTRSFVKIKVADQWLYLIGLIGDDLAPHEIRKDVIAPEAAFQQVLQAIGKAGHRQQRDYLVVLSHMGMERDQKLARAYPQIDWIIGAHTQSFTNFPVEEGNTRIVQVLGKNHYLGKIVFPLGKKAAGAFSLIEVRDELKDQVKPNPLQDFLDQYKSQVDKIRAQETAALGGSPFPAGQEKLASYRNCLGCHEKQSEFWMKTAHSLALLTLWQAKEGNNPQCISCHSLGFKNARGFPSAQEFAQLERPEQRQRYLQELQRAFQFKDSIRAMEPAGRKRHFKKWLELDEKHQVSDNYAHVQCLHCHDMANNHPFNAESGVRELQNRPSPAERFKPACLQCHTPERASEWYVKASPSAPAVLNGQLFSNKLRQVSCPKSTSP